MVPSAASNTVPDVLFGVVMGLLATYFFIADRDRLQLFIERHMSESFRTHVGRAWRQIVKAVGGYFQAQFKIMLIIYVIIWIGLAILGVNYAWLIGFGIAISADRFRFLARERCFGRGRRSSCFPAIMWMRLGMIVLYAIALTVHQLVQPKLVGDSVGMDPFAALFFMYIGYKVSGVFGMIVAIPAGMILINLYEVGAFDTLIWCWKEIVTDFNHFRRVPKDESCRLTPARSSFLTCERQSM